MKAEKIKLKLKNQEEVFSKCRRNFIADNLRKMKTSEILSEKDKEKRNRSRIKIKFDEECID